MRKLTISELKILDRLLFPETFNTLQQETELQYGEMRDDIINLMNSRLIETVNLDRSSTYFDADNIKDLSFRITQSGIQHMKRQRT